MHGRKGEERNVQVNVILMYGSCDGGGGSSGGGGDGGGNDVR